MPARDRRSVLDVCGPDEQVCGVEVCLTLVTLDVVCASPVVTAGRGSRLALEQAAAEGATTAWLFSRRSGPFWQSLGFEPADRDRLADLLADTCQVRLFRQTGQLDHEVAWSRALP